jgi:hypothetical protein
MKPAPQVDITSELPCCLVYISDLIFVYFFVVENEECFGFGRLSPWWIPQSFLNAEMRLPFPLHGRSLTSDRLVPVAQNLNPSGIQQPDVFRRFCM